MLLTGWESMMATLGLNPPARLGAHLLAQQRIPHAARASAVEGVADLSPVFEQSALSAASGWAADGLHIEKMALIMLRALR